MSFENVTYPVLYGWENGTTTKSPLNPRQVREIRSSEKSIEELAKEYRRSPGVISRCRNRKTYTEVK